MKPLKYLILSLGLTFCTAYSLKSDAAIIVLPGEEVYDFCSTHNCINITESNEEGDFIVRYNNDTYVDCKIGSCCPGPQQGCDGSGNHG